MCDHRKVYHPASPMTHPPMRKWICGKCLETGCDSLSRGEVNDRQYKVLLELKRMREGIE